MMLEDSLADGRLLSEHDSVRIIQNVIDYSANDIVMSISVSSWWGSNLRWARNTPSLTSEQRDATVSIAMQKGGAYSTIVTNQTDSVSLRNAVQYLEYFVSLRSGHTPPDMAVEQPEWAVEGIELWSEETFNRSQEQDMIAVRSLISRCEQEGVLSAGFIQATGARAARYSRDQWGREKRNVAQATQAQCSVTARHPSASGSGWAGSSAFDFNRVDVNRISTIALEKCMLSFSPVRLEPGRYQTILEPQATSVFASQFVSALSRRDPEAGRPVFSMLGRDSGINRVRTKIGLPIVDKRISIYHDPLDPLTGTVPTEAVKRVNLVTEGILTGLFNDYGHSLIELNSLDIKVSRTSFRFDGTDQPVESMISSTTRGLLLSQVSNPVSVDRGSLLSTGLTRNGLWLIEDGKITRSIRNFRWTESPLFIFNNVVEIGEAAPVFAPVTGRNPFRDSSQNVLTNVVVPYLKVNDFSFTSTTDAV